MARPHLLRWWLFGAALWLAGRTSLPGALRWALWLGKPPHARAKAA